jgi:hypothetical protein
VSTEPGTVHPVTAAQLNDPMCLLLSLGKLAEQAEAESSLTCQGRLIKVGCPLGWLLMARCFECAPCVIQGGHAAIGISLDGQTTRPHRVQASSELPGTGRPVRAGKSSGGDPDGVGSLTKLNGKVRQRGADVSSQRVMPRSRRQPKRLVEVPTRLGVLPGVVGHPARDLSERTRGREHGATVRSVGVEEPGRYLRVQVPHDCGIQNPTADLTVGSLERIRHGEKRRHSGG